MVDGDGDWKVIPIAFAIHSTYLRKTYIFFVFYVAHAVGARVYWKSNQSIKL